MNPYENLHSKRLRPRLLKAEQKTRLARFLDLAGDYLRDGYIYPRKAYTFRDDSLEPPLEAAPDHAVLPSEADSLEGLETEIQNCQGCPLHTSRIQTVPGQGASRPLVLVIGEGPGADEDASGRPFVGKAGQLLDRMLAAVDLSRERNCFITNVVKCRPPNNRDPLPEEIAACAPFLDRQLALLKPGMILCVGRVAMQSLLHTDEGIGRLRGQLTAYQGFSLLGTYHPSALLRDASLKRAAWEDLKILRDHLAALDEREP
ncbi:MAG: uracil-DNA glycosylase [Treponema sp.]|jgi:DNA polymerase|nr:uracil-DNA glycosylase [Treponema sp.]